MPSAIPIKKQADRARRNKQIIAKGKAGVPKPQIAREFGVTLTRIYQIIAASEAAKAQAKSRAQAATAGESVVTEASPRIVPPDLAARLRSLVAALTDLEQGDLAALDELLAPADPKRREAWIWERKNVQH